MAKNRFRHHRPKQSRNSMVAAAADAGQTQRDAWPATSAIDAVVLVDVKFTIIVFLVLALLLVASFFLDTKTNWTVYLGNLLARWFNLT